MWGTHRIYYFSVDVEILKKLVEKYTQDQSIYNKENNVISDCSIPSPPANLDCVDGNCVEII